MLEFRNMEILTEEERKDLVDLAERAYKKLHALKKSNIIIYVKEYEALGPGKKFSLHARVDAPAIIVAAQAHDWDVKTVVHKLFNKLNHELTHKFKK